MCAFAWHAHNVKLYVLCVFLLVCACMYCDNNQAYLVVLSLSFPKRLRAMFHMVPCICTSRTWHVINIFMTSPYRMLGFFQGPAQKQAIKRHVFAQVNEG